jgi:hypothetical protein
VTKATPKQLDYLRALTDRLEDSSVKGRRLASEIRKARNKVRGLTSGEASDYIAQAREVLK